VTDSLGDVWMLLVWPAYVVACGLFVGWVVARVSGTPPSQRKSVLAACAFGNSTGLPITLLTVIHAGFSNTTELGKVDPTLFLSVYLLLYPVLQWGIGGWMLAPEEEEEDTLEVKHAQLSNVLNDEFMKCYYQDGRRGLASTDASLYISDADLGKYRTESVGSEVSSVDEQQGAILKSTLQNVLNYKMQKSSYYKRHRGMAETDASLYISDNDLGKFVQSNESLAKEIEALSVASNKSDPDFFISTSEGDLHNLDGGEDKKVETDALINQVQQDDGSVSSGGFFISKSDNDLEGLDSERFPLIPSLKKGYSTASLHTTTSIKEEENEDDPDASIPDPLLDNNLETEKKIPFLETLNEIASRCLQPPVLGAILGLVVASTRLRGIFIDLVDRADKAPLEWIFDGIYAVGRAAVPLNMIILGCNLSAAQMKKSSDDLIAFNTMAAMVVGKMIVMPLIGMASCIFLKEYFWNIPEDIDAPFYLVAMIVFITPTANNVMVMVELSGSGTKEGIAQVIGFQYLCAPILLSASVTAVVAVASQWQ